MGSGATQYCAKSGMPNPLDGLKSPAAAAAAASWEVVSITNFDGEFEAKGVVKLAPAKKNPGPAVVKEGSSETPPEPPAPPEITFDIVKPQYAPECKDEVTP